MRLLKLFVLTVGFVLAGSSVGLADEMKVIDLATNPKPEEILKPYKMSAVKRDKKVFFTDFIVELFVRGEWVAGGSGCNKDVSAALQAQLVGLTDDKLQEIVDEAFAYAQQEYGKLYAVVPDAELESVLTSFEKIAAQEPVLKPEELRVETKGQGGFVKKIFVPGNKVRRSANGAAMGTAMAWYKAIVKLEATSISYRNAIEFARVSSELGRTADGKQASVGIQPQLSMVGGGPVYSNSKMATGMLQAKNYAGFVDASWVKETRKVSADGYEIVVDPELYKAAALKLLKAHIDSHIAVVKAELADD